MKVTIKGTHKEFELSGSKRVSEVLKELELNPETVLIVKDEEIITHDQILKNEDEIEVISVVSGG